MVLRKNINMFWGYFHSDFQIAILSFIITVNLNKLSLKFTVLDYKINF